MIGGIYLAYPIDQRGPASLDYLFQQIESFKVSATNARLASWVFDPGDAFRVADHAELDDSLPRINRAALNSADLVVAFLPRDVPSIGVPMEIDRARALGKHVMVFSDAKAWMLELPGIWRRNDWQFEDIAEGLAYVANLERPAEVLPHEEMRVKVEVPGSMPTRTYADDAGLDLIVSEDVEIPPGEFRDVPCGISLELPHYTWGYVTGRSSAFRKRGLLILPGVIDAGYRGHIFAGVWNSASLLDGGNHPMPVHIKKGERIAQLIIMTNTTRRVYPIQAETLSESPRGSNGFGSTGT